MRTRNRGPVSACILFDHVMFHFLITLNYDIFKGEHGTLSFTKERCEVRPI